MSGSAPDGFVERRAAVASASRRARWAAGAVLVAAAASAISRSPAWPAHGPDAHGNLEGMASFLPQVAWLVAGVLFLMWVHRAVANARLLGVPLKWTPGQAVWAYVIPVASIVLPYYVMRALHRASDPSNLSDAPVFRERGEANYRDGARELLPPPSWSFPAPILAWWILFDARMLSDTLVGPVAGALAARCVGASCEIAAGVLCVLVVRSIDARQRERCRRLDATEGVAS